MSLITSSFPERSGCVSLDDRACEIRRASSSWPMRCDISVTFVREPCKRPQKRLIAGSCDVFDE
jgi:hypothetical protein